MYVPAQMTTCLFGPGNPASVLPAHAKPLAKRSSSVLHNFGSNPNDESGKCVPRCRVGLGIAEDVLSTHTRTRPTFLRLPNLVKISCVWSIPGACASGTAPVGRLLVDNEPLPSKSHKGTSVIYMYPPARSTLVLNIVCCYYHVRSVPLSEPALVPSRRENVHRQQQLTKLPTCSALSTSSGSEGEGWIPNSRQSRVFHPPLSRLMFIVVLTADFLLFPPQLKRTGG